MSIPKFRGIRMRAAECYNPRNKISEMKFDWSSGCCYRNVHFQLKAEKSWTAELPCDFKIIHSVISYLIAVDWNSIRLSGFLLAAVSLCSRWGGGRLLKFGPFGNLASSQRLSSSLFHRPVDFHLFQRQKDEAFGGKWTAFGTYHDDRKRLDLHYCWSFSKGRGTKIKHFF